MLKRIKRLFRIVVLLGVIYGLFLFTFGYIYPVADKVEQAAAAQIDEHASTRLTLDQMPVLFQQAVLQTEDQRFYSHFGIDLIGIGRSIWVDATEWRLSEGGSTITQQLIRNTVIPQNRTFLRKTKEIVLAIALERFMSKDRILDLYLNVVYFGHGAYGAEQAAEVYFGKPLAKLSLAEWSLLAGLPNAPTAYDPYVAMDLARQRQQDVLDHMVEGGVITQQQATEAANQAIHLRTGSTAIAVSR